MLEPEVKRAVKTQVSTSGYEQILQSAMDDDVFVY